MRLGVSPIVSTVIVIAIVFGLAVPVGIWMTETVNTVTDETTITAETELVCQRTTYDFDTGYGNFGVTYNFIGAADSLSVKIINTGNNNLYNFSFELELNRTIGIPRIYHYEVNSTTQKTTMNPLKPGQSVVLDAVITDNLNGTLTKLKVMNPVCPRFYVTQEF